MKVAAIIPAAGMGTRMKSPSPKQFLTLEGTPIIVHTLRRFALCKRIERIVVPIRKADQSFLEPLLEQEPFARIVHIVSGGLHRQESVQNGFREVPADTDIVIVHDAVRPFVSVEMIEAVINEASKKGSAILALPCIDTVKQIERSVVVATLPREKIVLVQTPQAFRYGLLKEGFERARADHYYGTDESSLIERLGLDVSVVRGSESNIKITKPSDLPLAEFLIQGERRASVGNLR